MSLFLQTISQELKPRVSLSSSFSNSELLRFILANTPFPSHATVLDILSYLVDIFSRLQTQFTMILFEELKVSDTVSEFRSFLSSENCTLSTISWLLACVLLFGLPFLVNQIQNRPAFSSVVFHLMLSLYSKWINSYLQSWQVFSLDWYTFSRSGPLSHKLPKNRC